MPKRKEGPTRHKISKFYFFDEYVGFGRNKKRYRYSLKTKDPGKAFWLWEREYKKKWSKYYRKPLYKHGEGCLICSYGLYIEKHHFIPKSQNGSDLPDNLIKLCPNHHRLLHLALRVLNNENFLLPGCKNYKKYKEQLKKVLDEDEEFRNFCQMNITLFEKIKNQILTEP